MSEAPPRRAARTALLVAGAAFGVAALGAVGLVACDGKGGAGSSRAEAERLWRDAVWNPDRTQFRTAIPLLRKAAQEDGLDHELAFLLAIAHELSGEQELAAPLVARLRDGPPAPEPILIDGWHLALAHARPDAANALTECLARLQRPRQAFDDEIAFLAQLWRGEEHFFVGDWDGAIRDLGAAHALLEAHGGAVNRQLVRTLAESHRLEKEFAPAEALLRAAAERDPTWAPHAYQLGLVLAAQLRDDEAAAMFAESVRRDPQFPAPHIKLAVLARRDGELDAMREHLDEFQRLTRAAARDAGSAPDALDVAEFHAGDGCWWADTGDAKRAAGDEQGARLAYGRARESLLRALDANPRCARALAQLLIVARMLDESPALMESWEKALRAIEDLVPEDPAAADIGRTFC